jgi:hypothetical protein
VQDYSPTATYQWTPAAEDVGSYAVMVHMRSAGAPVAYETYAVTAPFAISTPIVITGLAANRTLPSAPGTSVTWTATATGGVAPLQYRFFRYNYGTASWGMVQDYSATATYQWTPAAEDAGSYAMMVHMRNAGATVAYETYAVTTPFTISTPIVITSLAADRTFPSAPGTTITWTAAATGGVAPLQYRFFRYNYGTASWSMVQDYSATATCVWTPGAGDAGSYAMMVHMRSAGAPVAYEAYLVGTPFTITP